MKDLKKIGFEPKQDNFSNVGKALFNATHAILYQAINQNGNEKQAVLFVNANESWFSHYFADGIPKQEYGKLEHINAYTHGFLDEDKSIIAHKSTAFDLSKPDHPFIDWCTQTKEL